MGVFFHLLTQEAVALRKVMMWLWVDVLEGLILGCTVEEARKGTSEIDFDSREARRAFTVIETIINELAAFDSEVAKELSPETPDSFDDFAPAAELERKCFKLWKMVRAAKQKLHEFIEGFSEPYFTAHYRCSDTTAKTRADIKAAAIMNAVEALFQNIGSFEMADLAAEIKKKDTEGQVKG